MSYFSAHTYKSMDTEVSRSYICYFYNDVCVSERKGVSEDDLKTSLKSLHREMEKIVVIR